MMLHDVAWCCMVLQVPSVYHLHGTLEELVPPPYLLRELAMTWHAQTAKNL